MCGIVGYIGERTALPILLDGLNALEYRGYDSAGLAISDSDGLWVVKRAGRVAELAATAEVVDRNGSGNGNGTEGVGHTRWATCGAPNEPNAHPHRDCTGKVAVVHNGIIENHLALRGRLEAEGHTFASATDSEVVAHLIESHRRPGVSLLESVRCALSQLSGSYALAVISSDEPSRIVGAQMDVPLAIGLGKGENFLASDVAPLLPHTRRVRWLLNGQLAELTRTGVRVVDLEGTDQGPSEIVITWDREAAEKSGYPDFMLKEIHEQPGAVRDTLRGRCDPMGRLILDEMALSAVEVRSIDKVFVVACGSSYHAGLVAKYAIEHWTRLPVEIDVASEFRYRDPVLNSNTLVVGISQSGETADTLAAVRYAHRQRAKVIVITNVVGSSLSRESDAVLYTHAGPEVGVAATKTLTAQMSALWLLGLWFAQATGSMYPDAAREILDHISKLPAQMERVLAGEERVRRLARSLGGTPTFLFIGRGVGYPVALEGALKLKEISYLHAEGFPAGEMKHGPIALIEAGVQVVVVATRGRVKAKLLSNVEEARARGARVIAVANPGDREVAAVADEVLEVPETLELLSPVISLLPLQLLAYHVAKQRGLEPDRPRNLAKSVTVE
ncbi:MAG: glutamine--fructose-6-phosphate transaminase (isomerizing) [Actinomycetota bacterium]